MEWSVANSWSGTVVFAGFFILYGLEFFVPLVNRRSRHFMSNVMLMLVLGAINFMFTSATFWLAEWASVHEAGLFNTFNAPVLAAAASSIVFLDFWAGYLVHFIFHQYEWLWRLHSVHHCDDLVDVTTTFRQHPIESIIRILFQFSALLILGIPVWILLVYLTLSTAHAQLEHANIRLPHRLDKVLQYVFVTPNMHKVHHSKYQHETDSNYSNIFSIWDRMFGTFRSRENYATIDYGLDYLPNRHYSFWELIRLPFGKKQIDAAGKDGKVCYSGTPKRE